MIPQFTPTHWFSAFCPILAMVAGSQANPDTAAKARAAGWEMLDDRDAMKKTYVFDNFVEAFGFIQEIEVRGTADGPVDLQISRNNNPPSQDRVEIVNAGHAAHRTADDALERLDAE